MLIPVLKKDKERNRLGCFLFETARLRRHEPLIETPHYISLNRDARLPIGPQAIFWVIPKVVQSRLAYGQVGFRSTRLLCSSEMSPDDRSRCDRRTSRISRARHLGSVIFFPSPPPPPPPLCLSSASSSSHGDYIGQYRHLQ